MARSLEKVGGLTCVGLALAVGDTVAGEAVGTTVVVVRVDGAGSARDWEDDDVHPPTTSAPAVSPSATTYRLMGRL